MPQCGKPDLTIRSIVSLRKSCCMDFDVLVVDNGSGPADITRIREEAPEISLAELGKNLGYGGACNFGIGFASQKAYEFCLLANNDTEFSSTAVGELIQFMDSHPQVGACQPMLLQLENPEVIDSSGQFVTPMMLHQERGRGEKNDHQYDARTEIFAPKGAALLARMSAILEVGGFDPLFFLTYDDLDLAWRLQLAGYDVRLCPQAMVYHCAASPTISLALEVNFYHGEKNRLRIAVKNYSFAHLALYFPLLLGIYAFNCFRYFVTLNWGRAWSVVRALGWNLLQGRETWAERKRIQRLRRVPDGQILRRMLPFWRGLLLSEVFKTFRLKQGRTS